MNLRLGIEIVTLDPTPVVVLARRAGSLQEAGVDGIQRVRKAVAAARVPTSGPPFVRYLSSRPPLRLEIGLPLVGPHAVPGLRTTILPGGDAASLWHGGSDADLLASVEELRAWVERNAEPAGDPWQWYWTEPGSQPSRIQLLWPVTLP